MKEILKEFIEEVCSTCKGQCDKGITFIYGTNEKKVRCVDYVKDEEKIVKPIIHESVTAHKRTTITNMV